MEEQINQKWDGNLINNEYQDRWLKLPHEKTWKDTERHEKYIIKCENEYEDRGLNFTDKKTPKDTERKDMKRYGKTRTLHYKMRKDRAYIDNRLFYLAWNNNHCCQLTSFGRKSEPKVRLKPF